MDQYPTEIAFTHGGMQHGAVLVDGTHEPLNNYNDDDISNCFICGEPAMSQPFYISDITGFMVHASCAVVTSARIIAGEHNGSILPSRSRSLYFNLHEQPSQYMNYYHSTLPPPPNYNYVNGNYSVPYPPPTYFNLLQQPPQFMNFSYSAIPPPPTYHVVNTYPHPTPPPPPPPPRPQNVHNNHHHGYGGMLGILGTSVVGAFFEALFDGIFQTF